MLRLEKQIRKHTKGLYNFSPYSCIKTGDLHPITFSKLPCDTCGSKLYGTRYRCTATKGKKHTNKRIKLEVCEDCFEYFFA